MPPKQVSCPAEITLKVIGGRWKVLILQELGKGTQRFGILHRALTGISHKTLTQQLRGMEKERLIERKIYPEVPSKVEYSLTPLGQSLNPVLKVLHYWGLKHS